MMQTRLKNLSEMLKGRLVNNDNLHRIAISNLDNDEKKLIRWWCDHYKQPPKPLNDYTFEELYIEHLEHYYSRNPDKIADFFARHNQDDEEWDGKFDDETEQRINAYWSKRSSGAIKKYQKDDRQYSDEEIKEIVDSLGKNLPGSKVVKSNPIMGDDEFDDLFD